LLVSPCAASYEYGRRKQSQPTDMPKIHARSTYRFRPDQSSIRTKLEQGSCLLLVTTGS
jgi:hypothetical protein